MLFLHNIMFFLPNLMLFLHNIMLFLPNLILFLHIIMLFLPNLMLFLHIIMLFLHNFMPEKEEEAQNSSLREATILLIIRKGKRRSCYLRPSFC